MAESEWAEEKKEPPADDKTQGAAKEKGVTDPKTQEGTADEVKTGEGEKDAKTQEGTGDEVKTGEGEKDAKTQEGTGDEVKTGEGEKDAKTQEGTADEVKTGEGEQDAKTQEGTADEVKTGEGEKDAKTQEGTADEVKTGEGEQDAKTQEGTADKVKTGEGEKDAKTQEGTADEVKTGEGEKDAKTQEGTGYEVKTAEGEKDAKTQEGTADEVKTGEGEKDAKTEVDKEKTAEGEKGGDDKKEESTKVEREGEKDADNKAKPSAEPEEKKKKGAEAAEGEKGTEEVTKEKGKEGEEKAAETEAGGDKLQAKKRKEKIKISESQEEIIKGIVAEVIETGTKPEAEKAPAEGEEGEEEKEEEEEEEEQEESESEDEEEVDRETCIYELRSLLVERKPLYARNLLLQSKLAEYYRKNNMEYAYSMAPAMKEKDKLQKYNNKLLCYEKLKKQEVEERKSGDAELSMLKNKFSEIMKKLESDFDMLQSRERDLAKGLKYTKTGKTIPDKVVERLLAHQAAKRKDVSRVRINYIKLRNYVAKKEEEKRKLEIVGEGLHLMDYEQLRMENQSIKDKIEERDEELQRLRDKATSSISILAHVKEKSDETSTNIQQLKDTLCRTSQQLKDARESANTHKMRHDWLRREVHRLHQEAGLLVQPKLLRHFEDTMESVNQMATQLQNLRNSYEDNKCKLVKSRGSVKAATKRSSNLTGLRKTTPKK